MSETTRPTQIDKSLYIKFGNKCRTNGQEIGVALEQLIALYLKEGNKIFK